MIMAIEIKAIPTLTGEEAVRFVNKADIVFAVTFHAAMQTLMISFVMML